MTLQEFIFIIYDKKKSNKTRLTLVQRRVYFKLNNFYFKKSCKFRYANQITTSKRNSLRPLIRYLKGFRNQKMHEGFSRANMLRQTQLKFKDKRCYIQIQDPPETNTFHKTCITIPFHIPNHKSKAGSKRPFILHLNEEESKLLHEEKKTS